jgi:hypothetical protein
MKKNAPTASTSLSKDHATKEPALSELETASRMDDISASSGDLTPVEAAILSMNGDLQAGMRHVRELKNHTAMLETAFKLMSYEMTVLSKNFQKKE